MTHGKWLTIAAVLYGVFGLGLLLAPAPFMSMYGVALDAGGAMMARILGSALSSLALMFWLYRGYPAHSLRPVMATGLLYNLVDLAVVFVAVLDGVMNAMGWGPVALHVLLAGGFGYLSMRNEPVGAPAA